MKIGANECDAAFPLTFFLTTAVNFFTTSVLFLTIFCY